MKNLNKYTKIPNINLIKYIAQNFNLNKYISAIIIQRVGNEISKIEKFLNPKTEDLHNPFSMNNMKDGINLILESIEKNEKILIYGDYDVDGITGISILFNFLSENFDIKDNLFYETANRFNEGYGLSNEAVKKAIKDDIKLIITVDCGTKDYETIEFAKESGIKILVLDHHEFGEKKNKANFIINPKCIDEKYQFKELSGCGVVFKLIQAISIEKNIENEKILKYLDLVAMSTACDLVPAVYENRIFLKCGIKKINENPQLGLGILIRMICSSKHISNQDLLFKLGPCINAPGRMTNAKICADLFINNDEKEINAICKKIISCHEERKLVCKKILKEIENINLCNDKKVNILYGENWHLGVLGIIATKCIEKKYVPTIIMTNINQDTIVGSCRSIKNINVVNILKNCSEYLVRFGGHEMAAGFLLKKKNLEFFSKKFNDEVEKVLDLCIHEKNIEIDIKMPLYNITDEFCKDLLKIGPFGIGNNSPVFTSIAECVCSSAYYKDTILKLRSRDKIFNGILKNEIIDIKGIVRIIYKVMVKNLENVLIDVINIEKL